MAYRANPFLGRTSERTTSDQEFVRLFSPKILERLPQGTFEGAVHIFRSPPGGGKTTLLRAFTPTALHSFWNARRSTENEAFQRLVDHGVLNRDTGPDTLGVFLSCASGYADLPAGANMANDGLFRALLNCRIVLRSLRSLASLLGFTPSEQLESVQLAYDASARDLKSIPLLTSPSELMRWAEQRERNVYVALDAIEHDTSKIATDVRFEGVLWLQAVSFVFEGATISPRRLIMIDDVQALRQKQRALLLRELVELRPSIPIWLAERTIALGDELLSQGGREDRDMREYTMEGLWNPGRGQYQFITYAQNILDRRLDSQDAIPSVSFSQYLSPALQAKEVAKQISRGVELYRAATERHQNRDRYQEWFATAEQSAAAQSVEGLLELYSLRILISRDEAKKQMTLELPLEAGELDERDSSQVKAAAEIFMHEEAGVPYYFGMERLCSMASSNVEELLSMAAALYDALLAKQVLRDQLVLSPLDQEKRVGEVAKRKRNLIPRNHTEGTRAQRLLDSVGAFCRDRTFLPNAPIAPGVTGVRLSTTELSKLRSDGSSVIKEMRTLKKVLSECVAENLLLVRPSAPSGSREGGSVFYLSRMLCVNYGLPLQMGGWQDVRAQDMIDWIEHGRPAARAKLLEASR